MLKMLIIADDFTGALDTGVQFATCGACTRVVVGQYCDFSTVCSTVDVLVQDAETRHLTPRRAYDVIFRIAKNAHQLGIKHIYKKTDSALRGNIGSELAAVLDATGSQRLHFIPALPKQGRTTINGIQYIDKIPVADSVFGKDPFEPVKYSNIADIIASQTNTNVCVKSPESSLPENASGIIVYDAKSDKDLEDISEILAHKDDLNLVAGCSGFASVLSKRMGFDGSIPKLPQFDEGFLIACGSVNPITQRQLAVASSNSDFLHLRLSPFQKLTNDWLDKSDGKKTMEKWFSDCNEFSNVIIDTNDGLSPVGKTGDTEQFAKDNGISHEQMRVAISTRMGEIVKRLLDMGVRKNIMLIGGDTLLAFMQQIDNNMLEPVCELIDGAVLSQLDYNGHSYKLISKSGGFGSEQMLPELAKFMQLQGKHTQI